MASAQRKLGVAPQLTRQTDVRERPLFGANSRGISGLSSVALAYEQERCRLDTAKLRCCPDQNPWKWAT
jgi:hypothetical protein